MADERRVRIVAEAGVNHGGKLDTAFRLVEAAKRAGADAIKFQAYRTEALVMPTAPLAEYQRASSPGPTQHALLRELELSRSDLLRLAEHCRQCEIPFFASAFDNGSLRLLVEEIGVDCVKLGSGEITHAALLLEAGRRGVTVWLSTGMAFLGEVETALGALAFGALVPDEAPSPEGFRRAFATSEGQAYLRAHVALFHCCSQYPTPAAQMNLRAIEALRAAFGLRVGLSDHSESLVLPAVATALGAFAIEKHFTLDREAAGPDHRASLDPVAFAQMVATVREAESALGHGRKVPCGPEWEMRALVRRGVYRDRTTGEVRYLRPENGGDAMSPEAEE